MKLKCKINKYQLETKKLLGAGKIEEKEIPNLTIGLIYEVIFVPRAYCCSERVVFYNDKKEWQSIYSDDIARDALDFFEPG